MCCFCDILNSVPTIWVFNSVHMGLFSTGVLQIDSFGSLFDCYHLPIKTGIFHSLVFNIKSVNRLLFVSLELSYTDLSLCFFSGYVGKKLNPYVCIRGTCSFWLGKAAWLSPFSRQAHRRWWIVLFLSSLRRSHPFRIFPLTQQFLFVDFLKGDISRTFS